MTFLIYATGVPTGFLEFFARFHSQEADWQRGILPRRPGIPHTITATRSPIFTGNGYSQAAAEISIYGHSTQYGLHWNLSGQGTMGQSPYALTHPAPNLPSVTRRAASMTKWHLSRLSLLFTVLLVVSLANSRNTMAAEQERKTTTAVEFPAADLEFFEKEVRPLLNKRCHECHSEEAEPLEAGLHLDSREGVLTGGDTGPAIVPGRPDESLLIASIHYGGTYEMPPDSKLPPEEIAILTKWVKIGAPWPVEAGEAETDSEEVFSVAERQQAHWCWQPLATQLPPEVKNVRWPRETLDRFVLHLLEEKGLSPTTPASRYHWIRRATFDLTGLPPTLEEVDHFIADTSPDAYERVVDRLLASPRFGEHWARYWMDLVRYGETKAFAQDYSAPYVFRYRDYLIRAYNSDLPYDQFVREALAGDLLENPRLCSVDGSNQSIIGPGFFYLTDGHHGPADIHADEARVFDTIIDTTSKAFLALTLSCCRCHDHKFDALSAGDYYSLYGVLASSRIDYANIISPQKLEQLRTAAENQKAQVKAKLLNSLRQKILQLDLSEVASKESVWSKLLADPESRKAGHPLYPLVTLLLAEDDAQRQSVWREMAADTRSDSSEESLGTISSDEIQSWFSTGQGFAAAAHPAGTFILSSKGHKVLTTFIGSSMAAGDLSSRLAGSLKSPTFILPEKIYLRVKGRHGRVRLYVQHYEMVGQGPTTTDLDVPVEKDDWHWIAFDTRLWKGKRGYLEILHNGKQMEFIARQQHKAIHRDDSYLAVDQVLLGDSTLETPSRNGSPVAAWAVQGDPPEDLPATAQFLRKRLLTLLDSWESGTLRDEEEQVVGALFCTDGPLAAATVPGGSLEKAIQKYRKITQLIPKPLYVRSLADGPGEDEPIYIRGNPAAMSRTPTPRHFLEAIDNRPFTDWGSGRRAWAEALVAPTNPLSARVEVNRIWYRLFGRGIVETVDNFGVKGKPPSHPELLDYLATDFIQNGWSRKSLIRKLVLSSSYRMSTKASDRAMQIDPDNIFLQHMNVRRLPAESIRDAILATSGSLKHKMYGPAVPLNLDQTPPSRARPFSSGPLDGNGRRTVYQEMRRNYLPPLLLAFDLPQAAVALGHRGVTNVPAQSLAMLNDPFVIEQANHWAETILKVDDCSTEQLIDTLHRMAFARPATAREIDLAKQMLSRLKVEYSLVAEGDIDNEHIWKDFCHMMLNRKEFIFLQ